MAEIITDSWLLHGCASGQCNRPISRSSRYCCAACTRAWEDTPRWDIDGLHSAGCDERHRARGGGFYEADEPVEQIVAAFDAGAFLDGITTAPVGPLKAPDMDEIRRIAEQACALRPEGDRFVMPRPMLDLVKGLSQPAPRPFGVLAPDLFAVRIFVDDTLPDNVIEFRDGDRVVQRLVFDPMPAKEAPMPVTTPIKPIDVYPVGLLRDLRMFDAGLQHSTSWAGHRDAFGRLWHGVKRGIWDRARARKWHELKTYFNGFLAEPYEMPPGVTRCGSGWTKARALRSLRRQYARAGLVMPDVTQ